MVERRRLGLEDLARPEIRNFLIERALSPQDILKTRLTELVADNRIHSFRPVYPDSKWAAIGVQYVVRVDKDDDLIPIKAVSTSPHATRCRKNYPHTPVISIRRRGKGDPKPPELQREQIMEKLLGY